MVEEYKRYHGKYLLTLVFASVFLFSFGMVSHNAFADTVVATIPMQGSAGENTVNPNTNMIYVQGYGNGWIAVIDGSTNSVASQILLTSDQAGYPLGIAANPDTNKIYADDGRGLEVIDGSSNSIVATIPITCSGDVAVNPNTNEVYVSDHFGNSVCVVNASTNVQVGSISVGAGPWGIGVNPNTNKIYVANTGGYDAQQADVAIINGSTNSVVKTIPLSGYGFQIGVNPNTNKIYVSTRTQVSYVINGATDTAVQMPVVLGFIGVNQNTNKIYSTDGNVNGQIDIINGTTDTMTSTLQISSTFSSYLGVNSNTNKVYVSVASSPYSVIVIDGNNPPSPPTGLTATTKLLKINLSWTAPSDNGGAPITGYMIERSTDNGSTWSTLVTNTGSTGTTYSDTNVQPLTTYTYRVSAINDVGTSDPSNTASASIPSMPTLP